MVHLALIGPGLVGKAVLRQIHALSDARQDHWPSVHVVAICNSRHMAIHQQPSATSVHDALMQSLKAGPEKTVDDVVKVSTFSIDTLVQAMKNLKPQRPLVILDCTASDVIAQSYPLILDSGISIVTPNKKAFSGSHQLWVDIQTRTRPAPGRPMVWHESSVGAGLPVIGTLKDLVATGDQVVKIEGIFSGTLSYVFNQFSSASTESSLPLPGSSVKFSDVITKAKELGYTEPDPRDDLNGMDVARKVLILARLSGLELSGLDAVQVDNIVPEELRTKSKEEFMRDLPLFDAHFDAMNHQARQRGKVLRLVGICDVLNGTCQVKLQEYDASHSFAQLKGSDNVIAFHTKRFKQPLLVQGAGAGDEVTAFGVVGDLLKCATILSYGAK